MRHNAHSDCKAALSRTNRDDWERQQSSVVLLGDMYAVPAETTWPM